MFDHQNRNLALTAAASVLIHAVLIAWAGGLIAAKSDPPPVPVALLYIDGSAEALVDAAPAAEPSPTPAPVQSAPPEPEPPRPEPPKPEPVREIKPPPSPEPVAPLIEAEDPEPTPAAEPAAAGPASTEGDAGPTVASAASALGNNPAARAAVRLPPDYERQVQMQIQRCKRYPRQSNIDREEGTVRVGFTLNRDGSVSDVRVVQSSGFPRLDEAAREAVVNAAPFPPFPSDYPHDQRDSVVPLPFHF